VLSELLLRGTQIVLLEDKLQYNTKVSFRNYRQDSTPRLGAHNYAMKRCITFTRWSLARYHDASTLTRILPAVASHISACRPREKQTAIARAPGTNIAKPGDARDPNNSSMAMGTRANGSAVPHYERPGLLIRQHGSDQQVAYLSWICIKPTKSRGETS
jgi:hypothetical protein